MSSFSPADAALEGFRIIRERPQVIGLWAVIQFAVSVASIFILSGAAGTAMQEIGAMAGGDPSAIDPEQMMALYTQVLPAYGLTFLLSIAVSAVMLPAVFRMVLRPDETSPGYLRLGADEFRQAVVMVTVSLIMFGAYLAGLLAVGVVIAVLGMLLGVAGGVMGVMMAVFALGALMLFLLVKFSLAGPATFDRRRIDVMGSWRMTKGRFWPILGCYLIAFVLLLLVSLLGMVVAMAPAAIIGGGMAGLSEIFQPDYSSAAAFFSPVTVIYLAVTSVISALGMALINAPAAVIYGALSGRTSASVF